MLSEPLLLIAALLFGLALLLMIALLMVGKPSPKAGESRGAPGDPRPKRTYGHYRSDNQLDGDLNDITLGLWKS